MQNAGPNLTLQPADILRITECLVLAFGGPLLPAKIADLALLFLCKFTMLTAGGSIDCSDRCDDIIRGSSVDFIIVRSVVRQRIEPVLVLRIKITRIHVVDVRLQDRLDASCNTLRQWRPALVTVIFNLDALQENTSRMACS